MTQIIICECTLRNPPVLLSDDTKSELFDPNDLCSVWWTVCKPEILWGCQHQGVGGVLPKEGLRLNIVRKYWSFYTVEGKILFQLHVEY